MPNGVGQAGFRSPLAPLTHSSSHTMYTSLLALLGWLGMFCPSTGLSGSSSTDSMSQEPLASPCSTRMFADQVAPRWAAAAVLSSHSQQPAPGLPPEPGVSRKPSTEAAL